MKRTVLRAVIYLLVIGALVWASMASAGRGGPNGTMLYWGGGADYAWYMRTSSGIVHQWRPNPPVLHVVLKPLGAFPNAQLDGCEADEGVLRAWGLFTPASWPWDNASLAFTIYDPAETYFYCGYEWVWPE